MYVPYHSYTVAFVNEGEPLICLEMGSVATGIVRLGEEATLTGLRPVLPTGQVRMNNGQ
jgi:hypothetical protein